MRKESFPYELIGEEVEIISSANPCDKSPRGKVVDETKFTLKIEVNGKIKTFLKRNIKFKLNSRIISGKDIDRRPQERLKG